MEYAILGSHLRSKQHKCLMRRKASGSEKVKDKWKWMHSKGMLYKSFSHSIHKYRSLLFVSNTDTLVQSISHASLCLHFTYVLHLFLYYLHFNHLTKSCFYFLLLSGILVFYCCITNAQKLKQCIFIVSQFLWVISPRMAKLGPMLRIWEGGSQGVRWAVFTPISLTEEKSAPKTIQIVFRIHCPIAVWGPSCLAGWQLAAAPMSYGIPSVAGGHFLLLEATHSFLPYGFLNKVSEFIKPARRNSSYSLLRQNLI